MKFWNKIGLTVGLCVCLLVSHVRADDFYTIDSVTTSTVNYFSELNLIEGPGVGFDADAPYASIGSTWVTDAPGGFPSDYIAVAGSPIIQLDLGADRDLTEISTWGYSADNSNGVQDFSLRFATDADGSDGYGTSIAFNPTYSMAMDPVPRQSNTFGQTVTARYVELTALSTYYNVEQDPAGGDRVGLGEIAFAMPIPEPSTFVLASLLLGFCGLVMRRR